MKGNSWMKKFLLRFPEIAIVLLTILIVIFFAVASEGQWLAIGNIQSVLQIMAVLSVMAIGATLVITVGEIDISLGSVFVMGAFIYLAISESIGVFPGLILGLLGTSLIGLVNGYLVGYMQIPSLVVTLGTLFAFRGVALAVTESGFFFTVSKAVKQNQIYQLLGGGEIFGLNTAIIWLFIVLIVVHIFLFFTPGGNRMMAVGGDMASANSRGINVRRIKMGAFVASGFLAGFAGILQASAIGVAEGSFGRQMELSAIAAAVLGGCVLGGGRSSVIGTVLGAFVLTGIKSYLIVGGIDAQWYMLLLGFIVVAATFANRMINAVVMRVARAR
jgi:ribose/xylose/arabinose/galactoside ABC-type transport system permease subunit